MDFKYDKIFNGWIALGMLLGFFFRIAVDGWHCILIACISMGIAFLILYPIYKIGGLGAGDVKLFMMIGIFLSTKELLQTMIFSFLIGAVISIAKIVSERKLKENGNRKKNKIHFALPICISVMLMLGGLL